MNTVVLSAFCALSVLFAALSLIRQLQMLQQNSYFFIRYFRWYSSTFCFNEGLKIFIAVFGALAVILNFGSENASFKLMIAVLLLWLLKNSVVSLRDNRHSIKKLVFTARVKRMISAAVVICLALGVSAVFFKSPYLTAVLFCLAAMPQLLAVIALAVMSPVEKAISSYYINDAKKLLRSKKNMKIIGITGSYGKTSTKFILGRILSERFNTLVTPENYNTPMGLVITVRKYLKPQTEIFIAEMGAKRKGDIKDDCDIANPTMGIITSIGPQHLDTFGDIETVISTKFELAERVKKNGGKMFLNFDNKYIKENADGYDTVSYGTDGADVTATDITYSADGLKLTLCHENGSFSVTSRLLGHHNALNIAAAAAVALQLGMTPDEIAFAVSKLKPVEHRLELKPYIGGATLIDDAYNSNPEGCLEAVRVLGRFDGMKKIIVTPGLVELGDREYECNKALGKEAAKYCDIIILVGKNRSVPLADGVKEQGFDEQSLYVVSSFAEALTLFSPMCDKHTVILFENDLPDNYLN